MILPSLPQVLEAGLAQQRKNLTFNGKLVNFFAKLSLAKHNDFLVDSDIVMGDYVLTISGCVCPILLL